MPDTKEVIDEANSKETVSEVEFDPAAEKALLWKCDIWVVPILFLLFLLSFIDRINIGNARLQGLERDLNMEGHDYNIALFIFFIPYILLEVPSNLILKKVAPSTWLSGIIAAWGIVTVCQGVTHSFAGLVVCRFLLGAFEAGFVPGCVYLISMYYKRHELQTRINLFFSASIIAGAFSGLLAYAIANMDGVAGYGAWRWIFILEGIATVVIAVASKFIIADWPETAKFLKEDERRLLIARLAADNKGATMDRLDSKSIKRCLTDVKVYLGILMYFGIVNTGYATSFFTPTILNQLGWTEIMAQVMSIPVFVVATVVTLVCAVISDRMRHRYAFTLLGCGVATIGYVILICQHSVSVGVRYMAVFMVTAGGFVAQPVVMAWVSNNMGGHYKRSIASSMQIGFGNSGGLVASNVFLSSEKPGYPTGFGTSLGLVWICVLSCTAFFWWCRRENRIRDAGGRDYRFSLPEDELNNIGDDHPTFRFTY
ncbi:hypothetical protein D8B26_006687 [Coccidioides posadasii str. Silveira]|uniref:MFS transporter n=2 Tax=Coccidioides posadasii TaxID=199306 RepID=E9CUP6_COCPS|nr:Major Facilitator Superfamily protein [Coccidioides posadasii C735 delta SOWgp]EER28038.1 Major Facilitator Superfamily protein [Coccidioides posadasii C735 delta SOWgp]EFW23174.1 MFS transporter [Coccidioides posadasii str. Silveira]QVM12051.1 hypothetical protein D8B26_006687 [Coccidioides posadasii str. Silveira]|eukprot:XP_003070183.1 Major Facilitator Superfamily protein [Coccidioides posadasii C735 delta SOWgp]